MTDGKSNDPKKLKIQLEAQKQKFSNKNAKIYALGVGGINNREIRMLTDNDPDSLFYLMSYNDIDQFLNVLEHLVKEKKHDPKTCLPVNLSEEAREKLNSERKNKNSQNSENSISEAIISTVAANEEQFYVEDWGTSFGGFDNGANWYG